MGFGFNLFLIFILLPLSGILLIAWLFTKEVWLGRILVLLWIVVLGLILFSVIFQWLNAKTILDKQDYYGTYVIKRDFFKGDQTDWQYDHFRFEITENDSIFFYVTNKEKTLKTYKGSIATVAPHGSARLIINMEQPTHHIMESNPTTYRNSWNFYLVFKSPKFYNLFFEKGQWQSKD